MLTGASVCCVKQVRRCLVLTSASVCCVNRCVGVLCYQVRRCVVLTGGLVRCSLCVEVQVLLRYGIDII